MEEAPTGLCDLCLKTDSPPSSDACPRQTRWPLKSWLIRRVGLRWAGGQSRTAFFIFTHFGSRCLPQFSDHSPAVQLMLPFPVSKAVHLARPCLAKSLAWGGSSPQMSPIAEDMHVYVKDTSLEVCVFLLVHISNYLNRLKLLWWCTMREQTKLLSPY